MKSNGSTLYLTRDIAAAIDRFNKFKFDKMYYVVENGQNDHFNALKSIINKMDIPWSDRIVHVKFGRIRGMSTRKGTAVFLKDILDECRELVVKRQIESPSKYFGIKFVGYIPLKFQTCPRHMGDSCFVFGTARKQFVSLIWGLFSIRMV